MSSRIYIPVFGSGLGHASRMALVADGLMREGAFTWFSSSYGAVGYLRTRGYGCYEVPGIDVPWNPVGGFSGLRQIQRSIPSMAKTYLKQLVAEVGNIESFRPSLVLSDTRLSGVLAACLIGTPSITVINQLRILPPPSYHSRFASPIRMVSADRLAQIWSMSKCILVPDLPPPHTISEANVWGVKSLEKKTHYVGFITPRINIDSCVTDKLRRKLDLPNNRPVIVAQISGPTPTKKALIDIMIESAKRQSNQLTFIISGGIPGGQIDPIKFRGGWYYEWCPHKDELLSLANVVITRGGHSTIGQLITLGKPILVIPIIDHSEQIGNASKADKLGLGRMVDQANLNADHLLENLNLVINDPKYEEKAERLKEVASAYNGVQSIVNFVMQFTRR